MMQHERGAFPDLLQRMPARDKLLSIARIVETDEEQAASAETVEEAPPSV
jgi:hypothetical protein